LQLRVQLYMSRGPSRLSSFLILVYAIPKGFVHSWARLSGIEHPMVPMKRKDAGSLIGALTFFIN
jgi:hypothetical protein